jgi:zinc/manganese transport system permease protein
MHEAVRFFAVQIALISVVLVLHTYVGLHIIRRTLVFSDLVLDQLAAFGALVGIGIGVSYGTPLSYLVSLGAVLGGAGLLAVLNPRNRLIPREAVIGILYALALVASLLLGDKLPRGGTHVEKTLTGSMLWVTWPLVTVTLLVYAALIALHWRFRRRFTALTDAPQAVANVRLWDFLFFATQGIITVLIVPVAGVLLAYAFLMIPAAVALLFTRDWAKALALGWGAGFAACVAGISFSYALDLPYGPTLVLALGLVFICAVFLRAFVPAPDPAPAPAPAPGRGAAP